MCVVSNGEVGGEEEQEKKEEEGVLPLQSGLNLLMYPSSPPGSVATGNLGIKSRVAGGTLLSVSQPQHDQDGEPGSVDLTKQCPA